MQFELNHAMSIVLNWFNCNKLSVNVKKSKLMFFGTPGQMKVMENIVVNAGDNILERGMQFKYLGVMLDPQLTFHAHCEYVKTKSGKNWSFREDKEFSRP